MWAQASLWFLRFHFKSLASVQHFAIHIMSPGLLNIYTHGSEFLNKRHDLMPRFSLQSPFIAWDVVHGSFSCVTWVPDFSVQGKFNRFFSLFSINTMTCSHMTRNPGDYVSVTFTYLYFISISICMFILLVCVYFMYNIWPVYRATQLNREYMHIKWCLGKMVHRQYIVKLTVCTDNHWKLFMLLNSRDTRQIHIYHWVNNIIINSILTQWFLLRCVKLSLTYLSAVFIQSFLNCKA